MQNNKDIWLLLDQKPGTASQAIALANHSQLSQEKIYLQYNFLANIPNFTFAINFCLHSLKNKNIFQQFDYFPKYIITAGRRSAIFSLYLKKQAQIKSTSLPKLIQIMHPQLPLHLFDQIILPSHDKKTAKNVLFTMGGLSNFDTQKINNVVFDNNFSCQIHNNKPTITLLIGGSFAKQNNFSLEIFLILYQQILAISRKMQANLLILNSKRTDSAINNFLTQQQEIIFFNWHQSASNYYLQALAKADFLVITGDSVSMISESLSTGKPIYIFSHPAITKSKHRFFHQQLEQQNFVKIISSQHQIFTPYSYKPLNEAKRLAEIIFSS
jgi:mitochondrial fission protein ELM1